jgi:RsiW-degrading membrane proteinase PrsW (M82 family)
MNFMHKILFRTAILLLVLIPGLVLADPASGIGGFASNMMEPVSIISDFVNTMAIIVGASFVFASVVKYFQYRVNPLATPLSTVIFLFILGIMLLFLPLAYKLLYEVPPYKV